MPFAGFAAREVGAFSSVPFHPYLPTFICCASTLARPESASPFLVAAQRLGPGAHWRREHSQCGLQHAQLRRALPHLDAISEDRHVWPRIDLQFRLDELRLDRHVRQEKFRQFDYDTTSDVILGVRYTSIDSGDKLGAPAADTVQDYIKSVEDLSREEGLFAIFDLKNDYPNEWYAANHPLAGASERVLTLDKLNEKLPFFAKGHDAKKIVAKNIWLFVSGALAAPISATQGGTEVAFGPPQAVGNLKAFVANDPDAAMTDLKIKIQDTTTAIDKMYLVERYVLA